MSQDQVLKFRSLDDVRQYLSSDYLILQQRRDTNNQMWRLRIDRQTAHFLLESKIGKADWVIVGEWWDGKPHYERTNVVFTGDDGAGDGQGYSILPTAVDHTHTMVLTAPDNYNGGTVTATWIFSGSSNDNNAVSVSCGFADKSYYTAPSLGSTTTPSMGSDYQVLKTKTTTGTVTAGGMVGFGFRRDGTSDSYTGDVWLHSLHVKWPVYEV